MRGVTESGVQRYGSQAFQGGDRHTGEHPASCWYPRCNESGPPIRREHDHLAQSAQGQHCIEGSRDSRRWRARDTRESGAFACARNTKGRRALQNSPWSLAVGICAGGSEERGFPHSSYAGQGRDGATIRAHARRRDCVTLTRRVAWPDDARSESAESGHSLRESVGGGASAHVVQARRQAGIPGRYVHAARRAPALLGVQAARQSANPIAAISYRPAKGAGL